MKAVVWCFYHPTSRRLFTGLDFVAAKSFCLPLTYDERRTWYVWRTGWDQWHPVGDIHELLKIEAKGESVPYPALPGTSSDDGGLQPRDGRGSGYLRAIEPEPSDLLIEIGENEFIPRSHTRHDKRFRVDMECQGRKFSTHTKDISTGGLLLEDALPNDWSGYLNVRVIDERSGAFFVRNAALVENQNLNARVRIEFVPFESAEEEKEFETWLEAA